MPFDPFKKTQIGLFQPGKTLARRQVLQQIELKPRAMVCDSLERV
jgi:hypothetical protein